MGYYKKVLSNIFGTSGALKTVRRGSTSVSFSLLTPIVGTIYAITKNVAWQPPPDGASWIWNVANAGVNNVAAGTLKMQQLLTTPASTPVLFLMACDDAADLYVNGTKIGSSPGFNSYTQVNFTMPKGTSRILAVVTNAILSPAGFTLSAKKVSDNSILLRSDGNWSCTTSTGV